MSAFPMLVQVSPEQRVPGTLYLVPYSLLPMVMWARRSAALKASWAGDKNGRFIIWSCTSRRISMVIDASSRWKSTSRKLRMPAKNAIFLSRATILRPLMRKGNLWQASSSALMYGPTRLTKRSDLGEMFLQSVGFGPHSILRKFLTRASFLVKG